MDLAQRIQAKTDNGDTIIDFLIEVMKGLPLPQNGDEGDYFKLCHRLQAARLLSRYGCCHKRGDAARSPVADEAINFILDNPTEPSLKDSNSGSSSETLFDAKLAMVIRESTDDGATVCRFLINVMEGELKAFTPQHRISAARELLTRGFGKTGARASRPQNEHKSDSHLATKAPSPLTGEGWSLPRTRYGGEGEKQESEPTTSRHSTPSTQPTESHKSPNPTNQSSDDDGWAAFMEQVTPLLDEDDRIKAELAEQDPDPYVPDLSAFDQAWENSEKWFYDWKNSLDPEEYETIAAREIAEFNAMIDTKIERRKQIAAEREQREKEEAERLSAVAEEAQRVESAAADEPGPPTRSQHKPKLMFVLGHSAYVDCGHPDCDLHEEDRNRWHGSVQYGAGPTSGHFP